MITDREINNLLDPVCLDLGRRPNAPANLVAYAQAQYDRRVYNRAFDTRTSYAYASLTQIAYILSNLPTHKSYADARQKLKYARQQIEAAIK